MPATPQDRLPKKSAATKKSAAPAVFDLSPTTLEPFPVKILDTVWELPAYSTITIDQAESLEAAEGMQEVKAFYNELLPGFGDALGDASAALLSAFAEAWRDASDPEGK